MLQMPLQGSASRFPTFYKPVDKQGFMDEIYRFADTWGSYQKSLQEAGRPPRGGAGASPGKVDYSQDPVLQKFLADKDRMLREQRARTTEGQWKLIERFGSQDLARRMFGLDPRVDAISSDPARSTSFLAQQARLYQQNQRSIDEASNRVNVNNFWSSVRAKQLADALYARQVTESEEGGRVQDLLQGLMDQYTQLEGSLVGQQTSAEADAYQRALDWALATGFNPQAQENTGTSPPPQTGVNDMFNWSAPAPTAASAQTSGINQTVAEMIRRGAPMALIRAQMELGL